MSWWPAGSELTRHEAQELLLIFNKSLYKQIAVDRNQKMSEEKPTLERQTSESLKIPERRVVVKDASELPTSYSTTPGGTMFSTTPGGKGQTVWDETLDLLVVF